MSSLSFCLSWKVSISPLFLKASFTKYNSLSWQLLSFSTLNIASHSLLAYDISAEASASSLMGVPLNVMSHFSLDALKIISLCLPFNILIIMCLEVILFWLTFSAPGCTSLS